MISSHPQLFPPRAVPVLTRRKALQTGATLLAGLAVSASGAATGRVKKVIVAGGGLAGLSCAFELMNQGHDVTLLEASRRTGGHVKTIRDPLPAGLYADVGAEQFPARPAYALLWDYVEKFGLTAMRWDRHENMQRKLGDRWVSETRFSEPAFLRSLGFTPREADYIAEHGMSELPLLYFEKQIAKFRDEYQPLGIGLDALDDVLAADLMAQAGASEAAIRFSRLGRRATKGKPPARGDASALYRIWMMAILQKRGLRLQPKEVFHLKGGNQQLPDTLAARLGARVRKNCPVTAIRHTGTSVTVNYDDAGVKRELTADYLVMSMSPAAVVGINVSPAWSEAKAHALTHTVLGMQSRVLLVAKTAFWKGDIPSINFLTGDSNMGSVCETATEVPGERRLLFGSGQPVQTSEQTIEAFKKFYPGKVTPEFEQCIVHQWWKEEPTCVGCERDPFPPGQLAKFWPHLIEPVGRIHFAGASYDNMWRGMEAATRSAHRAAKKINEA